MRIFNQEQPTPYYMFFDTETTGLPKNYNAPATDTDNWPRLVQLGWIVTDKSGVVCKQGNFIVKPEGFEIPEQASSVHGITTEVAAAKGKNLTNVLKWWFNDFADCGVIVGHNIPFDTHVVGAELCRIDQEGICNAVMKYKTIDTMRSSMQWCDVRKADGSVKFPKLIELYTKLFGHGFEDAHDAMADIAATKECFFELVKRGIIKEG
ncbi:MAG: 3'-5' exonuclease [Bacteroidales bacterium]|nr:3'-5' exonuclease [Candidatus Colicola equi]